MAAPRLVAEISIRRHVLTHRINKAVNILVLDRSGAEAIFGALATAQGTMTA